MPTAAATALVVTAAGATVAESAPLALDLTNGQAQSARTESAEALAMTADLAARRQSVTAQAAALAGRYQEAQRVARDKARAQAVAKAKAKAAADERARLWREGKRWVNPLAHPVKTSNFGFRWGRLHAGNDFGCPVGTPLFSMSKGEVVFAGYEGGYGNKVEVKFWDGTVAWYAHMSSISVSVGDSVMPGDLLGHSGNTGHSTGPHLHLEIHPGGGAAIDPTPWLLAHDLDI